eukprot:820260-Pyramimonas_sp.AAC.1
MGGSVIYAKPKAKSKAKPKKAPKKASSKKAAAVPPPMPDEVLSLATASSRDKYWADDLVAVITAPLQLLDPAAIRIADVKRGLYLGCAFALTGSLPSLAGGGVVDTAWSKVRKELREMIVRSHSAALRASSAVEVFEHATSTDVTDAILRRLAREDDYDDYDGGRGAGSVLAQSQNPDQKTIRTMAEDVVFVRKIVTFVKTNIPKDCPLPVAMQPAYRDLQSKIATQFQEFQRAIARAPTSANDDERVLTVV